MVRTPFAAQTEKRIAQRFFPMHNASDRVQMIQTRLRTGKESAANLDKSIADKEAKEFLLRPALNSLTDVETFLLPQALKAATPAFASLWFDGAELNLRLAEQQLKRAQDLLAKYGANLRVIGG